MSNQNKMQRDKRALSRSIAMNPVKMLLHVVFPAEHLVALVVRTLNGIRINMLRLDVSHQSSFVFEWTRPFAITPATFQWCRTVTNKQE
jgi:hypothetical protein